MNAAEGITTVGDAVTYIPDKPVPEVVEWLRVSAASVVTGLGAGHNRSATHHFPNIWEGLKHGPYRASGRSHWFDCVPPCLPAGGRRSWTDPSGKVIERKEASAGSLLPVRRGAAKQGGGPGGSGRSKRRGPSGGVAIGCRRGWL